VGATVGRAGAHQVVPVEVEEVRNATAESAPQDCEVTAGKRLITRLRREHPQMALIVIGDDLYSHVPLVEQLQDLRQHYVSCQAQLPSGLRRWRPRRARRKSERAVDGGQRRAAADVYLSLRAPGPLIPGEPGAGHLP
jgi:hypothetical protein